MLVKGLVADRFPSARASTRAHRRRSRRRAAFLPGRTRACPRRRSFESGDARGYVLAAGRATIELFNTAQAELIDEIEVGRRVAGPIRVALQVDDSAATGAAARRGRSVHRRRAGADAVEPPQRPARSPGGRTAHPVHRRRRGIRLTEPIAADTFSACPSRSSSTSTPALTTPWHCCSRPATPGSICGRPPASRATPRSIRS